MFIKLALKNIRRSIKDYAIYFFTLVLGVAIFYVFNAIESQTAMLDISQSMYKIVDLMTTILRAVSVFVAFTLGFLIIYASRFLIKRRGKEFGLYLTLGMGKRKISRLLLIETFFIGLISLVVGLVIGVLLSQFTSVLVANLFEANLTNFTFVFSASACIQTLIYFGVIYLVVMIFNAISISRQKLINLLSSARRSETIKTKNPWICLVVFLISAAMLAWAYYAVTAGIEAVLMSSESMVLVVLAAGGVATYLLFWSLSGLLLKIFMGLKKVYYHKLNSFTLRQFSSKINTTVLSMTVICLMLFLTICIFSSAMSIRDSMNASARQNMPVDVEFEIPFDTADKLENFYTERGVNLNDWLGASADYQLRRLDDLRLSDTLGELYDEYKTEMPTVAYDYLEPTITVSEYNQLARLFGNEEVSLAKDEYAILANYQPMLEMRNRALKSGAKIKFADRTLKPKYDKCLEGMYQLSSVANSNSGLIIIPDGIQTDPEETHIIERKVAKYRDDVDKKEAEKAITKAAELLSYDDDYFFYVQTRQEILDDSVGLSALVTFIGLYLGLIFLISSAAILALKELSESSDNREKFNMLRKIGVSEKMLNRALFSQIAIFFAFPLLIAIIHSIFGMIFCSFIISSFGGRELFGPILMTAGLLVIIYGGYFLITYFCSKSIIRDQRN